MVTEPGATDPSSDVLAGPATDGPATDGRVADGRADVGDAASDGQLVAEAIAGRRAAFDDLVRRYQRQAVAVSYRLLGNTEDALEVTQNAFLKAYTGLATLQKPEAFGGWLLRIVSNLSLNFRRGRKHRKSLPLDDLVGAAEGTGDGGSSAGSEWTARTGDPLHTLQSREMGRTLQAALGQLSEKQRLAIVMFTIDELPQKAVAEALDCSVEAVKWHVFQGRKRLRELLKNHLQD